MTSKYERLQEIIESYSKNSPEQGLKHFKKGLKKDPTNALFLLGQAHFLLLLGRHIEAIDSCCAITCSKNNVVEAEVLSEILNIVAESYHALDIAQWSAGSQLSALMKSALDNVPQHLKKDYQHEVLTAALRHGFFDISVALFARLSREHPRNANYHFAWIKLCDLQARTLRAEDQMGLNLRVLAFRSMKAAVDNTLAQKSDAVRTIKSAKELRLLTQIYGLQVHDEEILKVFNSPTIGITSPVAKNDIEFYRLKTAVLTRSERWPELKSFCASGLEKYCTYIEQHGTGDIPGNLFWADNWSTWDALLNAEAKAPEEPEKILDLIKRFQKSDKWHRNAGFASLHYAKDFDKDNLLKTCILFFDVHHEKVSCFDDISSILYEGLTMAEQSDFCQFAKSRTGDKPPQDADRKTQIGYLVSSTNSLKARYLLQYSDPGAFNEESDVTAFIVECLKLYDSIADRRDNFADDACMLAITAFMKLAWETTTNSITYSLQAACILSLFRQNSQHNFQAAILEILQARLLGLGSTTMEAHADLKLREVQFDTLSHLVYTRISTIHPNPVSLQPVKSMVDRFKDPVAGMENAMKWAQTAASSTLGKLTKDLDNVFFDQLGAFLDVVQRADSSFSSHQWPIEIQRIRRLTDSPAASNKLPSNMRLFRCRDNRDFKPVVSYLSPKEDSVLKMQMYTEGRRPYQYWAARFQVNEMLLVLLHTRTPPMPFQDTIMDRYIDFVQVNVDEAEQDDLTASEAQICVGWDLLVPIVYLLIMGPKHHRASKDITQDLAAVATYLESANLTLEAPNLDLNDPSRPIVFTHMKIFEEWYLHLELVKACTKLVETGTALSKQKGHHAFDKVPQASLQQIKKAGQAVAETVHKQARALKTSLNKDGRQRVFKAVTGGELGKVVEEVFGGEELRRCIEWMVMSAVEGLDGVLSIKAG